VANLCLASSSVISLQLLWLSEHRTPDPATHCQLAGLFAASALTSVSQNHFSSWVEDRKRRPRALFGRYWSVERTPRVASVAPLCTSISRTVAAGLCKADMCNH
jgi:hypothetical protein